MKKAHPTMDNIGRSHHTAPPSIGSPALFDLPASDRIAAVSSRAALFSSEIPRSYSIVIPLRDEVESLESLFAQLQSTLNKLDRSGEVILVDDGSVDGTAITLKALLS